MTTNKCPVSVKWWRRSVFVLQLYNNDSKAWQLKALSPPALLPSLSVSRHLLWVFVTIYLLLLIATLLPNVAQRRMLTRIGYEKNTSFCQSTNMAPSSGIIPPLPSHRVSGGNQEKPSTGNTVGNSFLTKRMHIRANVSRLACYKNNCFD